VVVPFPKWGKVFSLPVLVRLYGSEKTNEALGEPHKKLRELTCELIALASTSFPDRRFLVVADNNYANRSVVGPLPANTGFIGRGRMDAALYAPPPPYRGKGVLAFVDESWRLHRRERSVVVGDKSRPTSMDATRR